MQIETYRTRLEEFEQSLNLELYRYHSGRKDRLEIVGLYSDYSDFFALDSIREIEAAAKTESFERRRKSLGKIHSFLLDQHLDYHTAALQEEIARCEAKQTFLWEGQDISIAQVRTRLKREPDALNRRKLSERYGRSLEELASLRKRLLSQQRESAIRLGFKNYLDAMQHIRGIEYEKLLTVFEEAIRSLEDRYLDEFRLSLESSLGMPFSETGIWDAARWEERNDRPEMFPGRNLPGIIDVLISEMGIRPEQPSIAVESGGPIPGQFPAVCIPIRIPREIKILVTPQDGFRYYALLLHETGHAHHFAWTSPSLAAEDRILGDCALTESYAFLLEHFLQDREWLARMLQFTKPEHFLRFQALNRIFLIRQWAGRLRFAVRLHQQQAFNDAPYLYAETMQEATGLQYLPDSWTVDCDGGFAAADYMRGWALEAMLREYLRTRFGHGWASSRSTSGFLKEIWETGLLYRADELCREIGIGDLKPDALISQLLEGLQR